jgi:glycosyltransferase involved in cell wall biosynthesis
MLPDDRVLWMPGAILLGIWAAWRQNVSVVYSTSPNPSTLLTGYAISRVLRLPLVSEFRDPWMNNPFRIPRPFAWMERFESWLERAIVTNSAQLIVTSDQYRDDFRRTYPAHRLAPIAYVPNGYDPEDFENQQPKSFPRFTILHAGNFYGSRSSLPFLESLSRLLAARPRLRSGVRVLFIGSIDPETSRTVAVLGLDDIVTQRGNLSHRESISCMLGADLLLLVPGPGAGTMPGKIYEYAAARKPIFAIASVGACQQFVERYALGSVASPLNGEEIDAALEKAIFGAWAHLSDSPYYGSDLDAYSRRTIARSIASILDNLQKRTD